MWASVISPNFRINVENFKLILIEMYNLIDHHLSSFVQSLDAPDNEPPQNSVPASIWGPSAYDHFPDFVALQNGCDVIFLLQLRSDSIFAMIKCL